MPEVRRRPAFHVLVALVATLAAAGCIAFVNDDPSSLTTTCHFDGDDTACGRCVATSCAQALDTCCGDSVCSQTSLPLLASCFQASSLCSTFLTSSPDLATCIATSCGACNGAGTVTPDGGKDTSDAGTFKASDGAVPPAPDAGTTDCTPIGDSCFCSLGSPNGVTCNQAGIKGGGLCCASYGWPTATGGTCECEPFSCTPESFGIECRLGSDSTGTLSCSGGCSYGTYCECTGETCDGTQVAQCDVTQVGCDSSEVQVTSCSF
jgi:hypothetical protein